MPKRNQTTAQLPILLCLLLTSALFPQVATAQASYSFETATGPYSDLTDALPFVKEEGVPLVGTIYLVDLNGETFRLYGRDYRCDMVTPLNVMGWGCIEFKGEHDSAVINGFLADLEYRDDASHVAWKIENQGADRVLKVEWKRLMILEDQQPSSDYLSFQIWVYQRSGIIELRYGPRELRIESGVPLGNGPFIGAFRYTEDPDFRVLEKNMLTGNPFAPYYDTLGSAFDVLRGCPGEGTIFRMTPRVSSGVDDPGKEGGQDGRGEYRIFPNPSTGVTTLQAVGSVRENATVRLVDMLGRTVGETEMDRSASTLDLELPYPGLYYCLVSGKNGTQVYSVVRR